MDTVYDTTVVAYANGDLRGRKKGNALDKRLFTLEEFVNGSRRALYNMKLLLEYEDKIKHHQNDIIELFLMALADRGLRVARSTLSRQDYSRAKKVRWPSHDQHLLAAALGGRDVTIFVTEQLLAACATGIRNNFSITIIQL